MLTTREERIILNWMNDNFHQSTCFKPKEIYAHVHSKTITEDTVVSICRRLDTMDLIEEVTETPSDPMKINSCYRISQKGIDELTPNTREKQMFTFARVGAIGLVIVIIISIIALLSG